MTSASKVLIIAEAGVNHNGDLELAKKLIDVAADAGVDYVKFQTFKADKIVTQSAEKAQYQKNATGATESQYEMLKKLELTDEMHHELFEYCLKSSVQFLSTGFDIESVDFLLSLGQQLIKVPSGEITNLPYLRYIGSRQLPVILSTGMSTMDEIGDALSVLTSTGITKDMITVLHCTTEYPTPMQEVNLRAMQSIQEQFGVTVGYSDHTIGIEVSVGAVALGASVIEKHFTLDRTLPGPDHKASLSPNELRTLVHAIRNMDIALGSKMKAPTPSEATNSLVARKSIVASCDIQKGDVFSANNITTKRPGTGLSPMNWDRVIGSKATRNYSPDEEITE
jgi:N,N'-diacetyllegionaminate synthase